MSDNEGENTEEKPLPFVVDYDKVGRAKCKICKITFNKGEFRLGKNNHNPFGAGFMKIWHHAECIFQQFRKARATTKKIDDVEEDIENWSNIKDEDQDKIKELLKDYHTFCKGKGIPLTTTPKKDTKAPKKEESAKESKPQTSKAKEPVKDNPEDDKFRQKDNSLREFRRLCGLIADNSSYLAKTEEVNKFFSKGTKGDVFRGDKELWIRLLLPGVIKRVYNLQNKQLIKVFSQVFKTNLEEMSQDLEAGDVGETVKVFFEKSNGTQPAKKSQVSLQQVDKWLTDLENITKEEEQVVHLSKIAKNCTANDLKIIVRIIKADLRINAGAKHILEGVHPEAYEAFQTTRDLKAVLKQIEVKSEEGLGRSLSIKAKVLTPVLPMLANACKSVEQAFKKCPNGMYSEIKYDGERVQLHKTGNEFKYFSRSLKPVTDHKVNHFSEYIPSAFPHGNDLILDAEVLMINTKTGEPLPFGSLGKHKKNAFSDAQVCLFVFDCIHYNGENLMKKPLCERRDILYKNMTEVKNRVMFSEMQEIHKHEHLRVMIARVLSEGLEGLVLKDIKSVYEPGKRHWLKVKKDYLAEGAMADSADLVVLGAYYGTGKKGGMMSVFLMGCYDNLRQKWCTVTKVHTGLDDAALEAVQDSLKVDKISGDYSRLPKWIKCSKGMTPDFVVKDPKSSLVWEITGAEFTQNEVHTADGISIRFPRVTKQRDDKTWETATDLDHLKELFKTSSDKDFNDILGVKAEDVKAHSKNGDHSTSSKTMTPPSDKQTKEKEGKRKREEEHSDEGSAKKKKKEEDKKMEEKKKTEEKKMEDAKIKIEASDDEYDQSTDEEDSKESAKRKIEEKGEKNNKRKLEESEDKESGSPPKKPKKEESTEEKRKREGEKKHKKHKSDKEDRSSKNECCKYGTDCYNKSVHHLARFYHPPEHHKYTNNPLPDVFQDMKVCLGEDIDNLEKLTRYIVAFGGEVLPTYRQEDATHLCQMTDVQATSSGHTQASVTASWLWKCIAKKQLMPI